MNNIRQIQELNKRELENGVSPDASWHADYRDTAYIYVGGLPFELSEGDIITIFSQYGEPAYVNLIRDKETGKSKGFAFLKYEDQRSTDLAVDNLGGATVMNRTIRVDHTRYKRREDDNEVDQGHGESSILAKSVDGGEKRRREQERASAAAFPERPMLQEKHEVASLMSDYDNEDPMKDFLLREGEKEKAISSALPESADGKTTDGRGKYSNRHRHHHSRPSDRSGGVDEHQSSKRHSRHRRNEDGHRRSRSRD